MKKLLVALGVTVICSLGAVSSADAAATYTVAPRITYEPQGNLYKEVARPVNMGVGADITPPDGSTTVLPLMNSTLTMPKTLAFVPDPNMPVCTAVNAENANFPPETARSLCATSLIGDGSADLYLAGQLSSKITDPVLSLFNGGKNAQGGGIIIIQAYSASTGAGIYQSGSITNGVLSVDTPRLTADSASPNYQLNIPGEVGLDQSYVQVSCPDGSLKTDITYHLGNRDAVGTVSNATTVTADQQVTPCNGLAGKPTFANLKVKAPKKVKNGKKGSFKVTVTNKGTASSKKGTVKASGAGKGTANLPVIKPGATKTVTVKAKVTGKKGKKVAVKFKASGGASASGSTKVKVG